MLTSIAALATSKRFIVAVATALVDATVLFGLELPPDAADKVTTLLTALGGVVVLGISISDHGKAMGQPPGTDHKGRS
jgi:hypothetical protein